VTNAVLAAAAVFFLALGLLAMRKPSGLLHGFGITAATTDARNEVRAVYGGFPLALAVVLLVAIARPELRSGVVVAAAASLGGMAGGRMVSAAVDHGFGRLPVIFTLIELVVAGLLLGGLAIDAVLP